MSIHSSLSASEKSKKLRSVLKRSERLKIMIDKGTWKDGQSVFALPKIKTIRIKIKKEKAAPAAAAGTESAAATPEAAAKKEEPTKQKV